MDVPVVVDPAVVGGLALVLVVFGFIEFGDQLVAKITSLDDSNNDLLLDDID